MLDLMQYLRPKEIQQLRLRKAFMRDRDRLIHEVNRNPNLQWRALSIQCGYKPDTLTSIICDNMVHVQQRYNFKALVKALEEMGMEPSAELKGYNDE